MLKTMYVYDSIPTVVVSSAAGDDAEMATMTTTSPVPLKHYTRRVSTVVMIRRGALVVCLAVAAVVVISVVSGKNNKISTMLVEMWGTSKMSSSTFVPVMDQVVEDFSYVDINAPLQSSVCRRLKTPIDIGHFVDNHDAAHYTPTDEVHLWKFNWAGGMELFFDRATASIQLEDQYGT